VHVIAEDYGMLQFPVGVHDVRAFWDEAPRRFGEQTGTDLFIGRHAYGHFAALGFTDITLDYVIVDTLRVPRETFATILEAWRDGYVEPIAEFHALHARGGGGVLRSHDRDIRDPARYAVWFVPVIGAACRASDRTP